MKLSVQVRALYQHDHSDQITLGPSVTNTLFVVALRPINGDENATPRLIGDFSLVVSAEEINTYKVGQILTIEISDALAGIKL